MYTIFVEYGVYLIYKLFISHCCEILIYSYDVIRYFYHDAKTITNFITNEIG